MKKVLFMLLCAAAMVACGNKEAAPTAKVHVKDVTIERIDNKPVVSKDGQLYTGELYTASEGASIKIKNGHPTWVQTVYHENGNRAIHGRQSLYKYFDEEGNRMAASEFEAKYMPALARRSGESYYEFNDLN